MRSGEAPPGIWSGLDSALYRILQGLVIAAIWLSCPAPVSAGEALRGTALVIGNGDYEHLAPLANPPDDADAIEELLSDLGFDSVRRTDRDADDLARDIERFAEDAAEADVAILYYAGHGIEAGGENWLVPVDADISALDEAATKLVPVSQIIQRLRQTVPVTIVLLDACRDNPFPSGAALRLAADADPLTVSAGGLSEPGRGASPTLNILDSSVDRTENLGIVIGFAAAPGQVALDGEEGGNSPYAAALTRHISAMTGQEFGTVMRMVAEEVYLKTDGRQRPWINESLRRLLYFGDAPEPLAGDEGEILAERRQLLLTIAALPDLSRRQVERVASQGGVAMDAIYGMLKALGQDAPDDPLELEKLLEAQAEELKVFLAERRVVENADPVLARLSALSNDAVAEGAIETARRLRTEVDRRIEELSSVIERQEDLIRARRREFAAEYARSAEINRLAFDYLAAAAYYEKAFKEVERWDEGLAWEYKHAQTISLMKEGQHRGNADALRRAAGAGREAIEIATALGDEGKWSRAQNSVGNALWFLGENLGNQNALEQSAVMFRDAIVRLASKDRSVDRAWAQANLARTLSSLAARDRYGEIKILEASIAAYRAALGVQTRGRDPRSWAMTTSNMGGALLQLGAAEFDIAKVKEGADALKQSLEVFNTTSAPFEWARIQNNLGVAYTALAQMDGSPEWLDSALAAHRAALTKSNRNHVPLQWALTHFYIGEVLKLRGTYKGSLEDLRQAISSYELAVEGTTMDRAPLRWANIHISIGQVNKSLVELGLDNGAADKAVSAYKSAQEVYDRRQYPETWSSIQHDIAVLLRVAGVRAGDVELLRTAVAAEAAALETLSPHDDWLQRALVNANLGHGLVALGRLTSDPALLRRAKTVISEAREGFREAGNTSHDGYFESLIDEADNLLSISVE